MLAGRSWIGRIVTEPVRVVVFAWGNDGRCDDGLGPRAAASIEAWGLAGVRVVASSQLQPEHALDLKGAELALFVDAAAAMRRAYALSELVPAAGRRIFSHSMSPSELLALHAQLDGGTAPPAFLLTIRGTAFGMGLDLSMQAEQDLVHALACAGRLLAHRDADYWRQGLRD